jgi:hypothetical protein
MNLLSKCAASTARLGASESSLLKGFRSHGIVSTIPSSNICQLGLRIVDSVISNKGLQQSGTRSYFFHHVTVTRHFFFWDGPGIRWTHGNLLYSSRVLYIRHNRTGSFVINRVKSAGAARRRRRKARPPIRCVRNHWQVPSTSPSQQYPNGTRSDLHRGTQHERIVQ